MEHCFRRNSQHNSLSKPKACILQVNVLECKTKKLLNLVLESLISPRYTGEFKYQTVAGEPRVLISRSVAYVYLKQYGRQVTLHAGKTNEVYKERRNGD